MKIGLLLMLSLSTSTGDFELSPSTLQVLFVHGAEIVIV